MKKYKFILVAIAMLGLITACEDYNTKNFPGYEDFSRPKNLATYTYQLTGTDFVTLGDAVKKPVEALITAEQERLTAKQKELKAATNPTDSARLKGEYDALKIVVDANVAGLKLDPKYVAGMFLKTYKFFNNTYTAADYVPYLLNTKYKYADTGSTVQLTYKFVNAADTIAVANTSKYLLTTDDYNVLGEAANQPGQYDNFSATVDPDVFIPKLLAVKYPLAQKGDVKMIRYLFYASPAAAITYSLYLFNGSVWIPNSKTEQFLYANSHEWIFDPTITITPDKNDFLLLMPYIYDNNGKAIPTMEGSNEWTSSDTLRFVINPLYPPASATDFNNVRTEFFFGTSWYYANIDVRITSRTYAADKELMSTFATIDASDLSSDAKKAAKTAFLEKRVKQGLALMLSLKYPELETQVKGIDQHVKVNVQLYDGARWYWTYNYQCIEKGKFSYIERVKWK